MEFLAGLYTLLLVTICLLLAVVLWKLNKPCLLYTSDAADD